VAFMWLLQKLRPAHKTRAAFRQHTLQPLRQVCREGTVVCKQHDLCAGALVAMDGSQCQQERRRSTGRVGRIVGVAIEGKTRALCIHLSQRNSHNHHDKGDAATPAYATQYESPLFQHHDIESHSYSFKNSECCI
jgi:hypothetical protein